MRVARLIVWGLLIVGSAGRVEAQPQQDSTSTNTGRDSEQEPGDPLVWWKERWFPVYHWSGYGMRPYFGASPLYPESFVRSMTALRFNRVEGLTLGFGIPRLSRIEIGRFLTFGQLSYAFSLDKPRYRIATEYPVAHLDQGRSRLLAGVSMYSNTATNDLWKISDLENSLGAFFFEEDHLDYFDLLGWSGWLTGEIGLYGQLTLMYRDDRYRSMYTATDWSLFGTTTYRANPLVEEGRMHSIVLHFDAGRVGGLNNIPQGWSIQAQTEMGSGLGGDFDFRRFWADSRLYVSPQYWYGFAFRVRGGLSSDAAPVQKTFTIGGLGTARAWPQNSVRGTRFVAGSAEAVFGEVDLLVSGLQFFVLGDVAWAGYSDTSLFSGDETLGAIGCGVGFDQRRLRIEFALPVGRGPHSGAWVWLRLFPAF